MNASFKILLRTILNLVFALLVASLLIGLTVGYYRFFPSTSGEGSAWGNMDDALSITVIAGLCILVMLTWWTVKLLYTMVKHQHNIFVLSTHLLLLILVYVPLIFYIVTQ